MVPPKKSKKEEKNNFPNLINLKGMFPKPGRNLLFLKDKGEKKDESVRREEKPPILFSEENVSWGMVFKKILSVPKNHHWTAAILISLLTLVGVYNSYVTRADVAHFFAETCLGTWKNSSNAEGEPQAVKGAGRSFTKQNSAILKNSYAEIFCGSFKGEFPEDAFPHKAVLKFSWFVGDASKESSDSEDFILKESIDSEESKNFDDTEVSDESEELGDSSGLNKAEEIEDEEESDSLSDQNETNESEVEDTPKANEEDFQEDEQGDAESDTFFEGEGGDPENDPESGEEQIQEGENDLPDENGSEDPQGRVSNFQTKWVGIEKAFAQETESENETESESESDMPNAIENILQNNSDFLEIKYTFDGNNWVSLGTVGADNWRDVEFELPIVDWEMMSKIQISVQSIEMTKEGQPVLSIDEMPEVYLDSVWIEVSYKNERIKRELELSEIEALKSLPKKEVDWKDRLVSSRMHFNAGEDILFEFDIAGLGKNSDVDGEEDQANKEEPDEGDVGGGDQDIGYQTDKSGEEGESEGIGQDSDSGDGISEESEESLEQEEIVEEDTDQDGQIENGLQNEEQEFDLEKISSNNGENLGSEEDLEESSEEESPEESESESESSEQESEAPKDENGGEEGSEEDSGEDSEENSEEGEDGGEEEVALKNNSLLNPKNFLFDSFLTDFFYIKSALAQAPVLTVVYSRIVDPDGSELGINPEISESEGKMRISVPRFGNSFKPGKYRIEADIAYDGELLTVSQEFTLGVLAVNLNKSIFTSGDLAYFQMAALTDTGHTICDADLELELIHPDGEIEIFSTSSGSIIHGDDCGPDNVTDQPDYYFHKNLFKTGTYSMTLVNVDNGYFIGDSFEVENDIDFIVERVGATRINPFEASYKMTIFVESEENFSGTIAEKVPVDFEIIEDEDENFDVEEKGESKMISWQVDIEAGETLELNYVYQAPPISPQFYLLGPLQIYKSKGKVARLLSLPEDLIFEEARQWQIASDADTGFVLPGLGQNVAIGGTTNWNNPGNITAEDANNASINFGTSGSQDISELEARLAYDGGFLGVNQSSFNPLPDSQNPITYGGSSNTWGSVLLTPAVVNDSTFGFAFRVQRLLAGTQSARLVASDFGFNVPSGATINGVEVEIDARRSTESGRFIARVYWVKVKVYYTESTTISGNVYGNLSSTVVWDECDGTTENVSLVINSGTAETTSCDETTGAYSFDISAPSTDDPVSVFINQNEAWDQIAHFKLSEDVSNTDVVDSTGTQSTATASQNTANMSVDGKIGKSLSFNGTSDYVNVPHDSSQLLTDGFTVSAWIKPDGSGSVLGRIVDKSTGVNANNGFAFFHRPSGASTPNSVTIFVNNNTSISASAGSVVGDGNTWFHVIATVRSDGSATLYVNNSQVGSGTTGATSGITTTNDLRIGNRSGNTDRAFNGEIDDVRIFSRVLTPEERLFVYSGGNGTEETDFGKSGVTVALADGNDMENFHVEMGHIRLSGAGSSTALTFSHIFHCDNADTGCGNVPYSDTSGRLVADNGYKIVVESGRELTAGHQMFTSAMVLEGTFNAGSFDMVTLSSGTSSSCSSSLGDMMPLCIDGGTFNADTGDLSYRGEDVVIAPVTYNGLNIGVIPSDPERSYALGGNTTVQGVLTFSHGSATSPRNFNAGSHILTLSGNGTPFVINANGQFNPGTSTVIYNSTSSIDVESTDYYNLEFSPSGGGSRTYSLEGGTFQIGNDFTVGDGTSGVLVDIDKNNPDVTVDRHFTVNLNSSLLASASSDFEVGGNWTNNGTFTHNDGTVTFNSTSTGRLINSGGVSHPFFNVIFDGVGGGWSPFTDTMLIEGDLIITNGSFNTSAGTENVTVNGHVQCGATCGEIDMPVGNTFTQSVTSSKNFGTNVATSTDWTFTNLTFHHSCTGPEVCAVATITFNGTGTGKIIASNLSITSEGTTLTVDNNTNDRIIEVGNNVTIGSRTALEASSSADFKVGRNWTNNGTFVHNSGTVTFNSTSTGRLINSGGVSHPFFNVIFDGVGGGWSPFTNNMSILGDLTMVNGSFNTDNGTANVLVAGNVECGATCGVINMGSTNTFTHRVSSNKTFGTNVATATDWTFNNLTFRSDNNNPTITINGTGTGKIAVNNNLTFSNLGVGATLTVDNNTNDRIIEVGNNVTIGSSTTLQASSLADFKVGGSWTSSGNFNHNNGTVTFDATTTGKTISDGGDAFYDIVFDGSGGGWLYQDSSVTAPNSTVVDNGTATFLNAKTGSVTVNGGTLNVDWYLAVKTVALDNTDFDIEIADGDITISENSDTPQSTIFKHSGVDWGTASSTQVTSTGGDGFNPQPNSAGALRIREYSQTSGGPTFYKYNVAIDAQAGFSEYDYFDDHGNVYIISTSSASNPGLELVISDNWHRSTAFNPNSFTCDAGMGDDCLNEGPGRGSWYLGMVSDLIFEVDSLSADLGTLNTFNDFTSSTSTVLTVTTSFSDGYTVTAYAANDGRLKLDGEETYIDAWLGTNETPTAWVGNCKDNSQCGFGYTTSDNDLGGVGDANRFGNGANYAGFTTSGPGDPVADSTSAVPGGENTTITYKVSAPLLQAPGNYLTTVFYIASANY